MSGKNHVRSEGNMIFDHAVVPDVIAAPQDHVVADRGEWLNGIVLEYETVITDRDPGENGGFRTDVADQIIPLLFDLPVNGFAQPVHATRRHRSEETKLRRRI